MPFAYPEVKQFVGLKLQANTFMVPDGALEVAENVVITRDFTIDKSRGFYQWATVSSGTINALTNYNNTLLALRSNGLSRFSESGSSPNEVGTETAFTGETVTLTAPRIGSFAQSNKNLYFTTDNGVMKIESTTGAVFKSGIPPALDLRGYLFADAGGPITNPNQAAWRVVFGRRDANSNLLLGAPSDILVLANSTATQSARLEFSIPSEITSSTDGYFWRLYRSDLTGSASVTPGSTFKLVDEKALTAADITLGAIYYTDDVPDILRGAELYTNENSQEGESEANSRAPLCDDIALFKEKLFFFNTVSRHSLNLDVQFPGDITAGDLLRVQIIGGSERTYVARESVANQNVTGTAAGTGTITITYTAHGLSNGDTVQITKVVGGALPVGNYVISGVAANTFDITSAGNTATSVDFFGLTNSSGQYLFHLDKVSSSPSVQIANTARGIVKAINRDTGSEIYARYVSTLSGVPGKMRFDAKGFGNAIRVRMSAGGSAFLPALPTAYGSTVSSSNDDDPNGFFVSKVGEPDAVPLSHKFFAGAKSKAILRGIALRDSVIILKEDGIYRMTGDGVGDISVTILDDSLAIIAADSARVIDNEIYCLTDQGFVAISDSSVRVISRDIQDVIQPILGYSGIATETSAIQYQSENAYYISVPTPASTTRAITYVYQTQVKTWTTITQLFKGGIIGPKDRLFLVTTDNKIIKERKTREAYDFMGQNYSITVTGVASDLRHAVITSASTAPMAGWVIVKSDTINRITEVTSLGGSSYGVTFLQQINLVAADVLTMYAGYPSQIKFAPFHGGAVGRNKQFSEVQLHFRGATCSMLDIYFTNNFFNNSQTVSWSQPGSSGGWGNDYWGFFGWGQAEGVALRQGTTAGAICRTYVPILTSRGTFIQAVITHNQAGESLSLQSVSWAVRGWNHITTR